MEAAPLTDWWPDPPRILGQLSLEVTEVESLAGGSTVVAVDNDQDQIAVFRLADGAVVALVRSLSSPESGFILLTSVSATEVDLLDQFLAESGLDEDVVTWRP